MELSSINNLQMSGSLPSNPSPGRHCYATVVSEPWHSPPSQHHIHLCLSGTHPHPQPHLHPHLHPHPRHISTLCYLWIGWNGFIGWPEWIISWMAQSTASELVLLMCRQPAAVVAMETPPTFHHPPEI